MNESAGLGFQHSFQLYRLIIDSQVVVVVVFTKEAQARREESAVRRQSSC